MKILLAEDNEDNYLVVKSNLKRIPGHELLWAKNGKELLDRLEEGYEPDMFFVDIEMPVMDGREVIKALRNNQKYKNIPIIVVTASIFADMKSNYKAIGADEILEKPFSRSELLTMIEKYAKR